MLLLFETFGPGAAVAAATRLEDARHGCRRARSGGGPNPGFTAKSYHLPGSLGVVERPETVSAGASSPMPGGLARGPRRGPAEARDRGAAARRRRPRRDSSTILRRPAEAR